MSPWIRLIEKLTGAPHKVDDSARVRLAAEAVKESSDRLQRYFERAHPIAMLGMYSRSELNK